MYGGSSKRSFFSPAVRPALSVCIFFAAVQVASIGSEEPVSNLKRQFVKTFLQAEKGDPAAQYDVGMMYYSGQQIPQDKSLAAIWITKAAEQGYPAAQYFLSLLYGLGDGVLQSDQTAAVWCRKAAEQGHADAQYALGRMYTTGQGLPQDDAQAVRWYTKAAEQGHADAQCDLGLMYQSGRGVKRDVNQAVQWWVKASQQGHTWSSLLLQESMKAPLAPTAENPADKTKAEINMLLESIEQDLGLLEEVKPVQTAKTSDVKEQPATAADHKVEPPADEIDSMVSDIEPQENAIAESDTVISGTIPLAEDITGPKKLAPVEVPVPPVQAETPVEDSDAGMTKTPPEETAGTESDMVITGTIPSAEESIDLIPQRPVEIPVQPQPSDENEAPSAQYEQAVKYYEGAGVKQDYAQALEWFKKAARQGHAEAQYKLGVMYSFGQGTTQNSAEAVNWFRKAAEQGLAAAQYSLGVMYGTGQGVPLDLAAAVQWYTRAANQGSVAAQFMLGLVYSKGQGVTRDSAAAVQWYTRAAEQGSPSAQYVLAVIYDKGQGLVLQDEEEAVKWYTRAAEAGHADAQYDLATKYSNGQGVERDYVTAYMWCLIAGTNDKDVTRLERWLEPKMNDAQREQARQRAREIHDRNTPSQVP